MNYNENEINGYMQLALKKAREAAALGEIPVGAVVVWQGRVISAAGNLRQTGKNALYHAELKAINDACEVLGGWRLHKASIFVTLEPCVMCAGACINARIAEIYYGATDARFGALGGMTDILKQPFNHIPKVYGGIKKEECETLLKDFFADIRAKKGK